MIHIAFVFIAEAYQAYHGAAIALELAARRDVTVTIFYNDPGTLRHLERIRLAFGAMAIPCRPLRRSLLTRALQSVKRLGMLKPLVLWDSRRELARYDAIVGVEDTLAWIKRLNLSSAPLIYYPHGAGDRARGFGPLAALFDLVLLSGCKSERRMLDAGLVRTGSYAVTGSVKLDTAARVTELGTTSLFPRPGPIVLYNAHKEPKLSSWRPCIAHVLESFARQDDFNLIVAPHVKLFHRRSPGERNRWEAKGGERILIDTGSERSVDMSYTAAADIYVGDVSSQVYEFLITPRPCVFLNPHNIDWRDDPNFAHWHLGDVVDDPAELMSAISAAPARHHLYRGRQKIAAAAALGERSPQAALNAAEAIMRFLGEARARSTGHLDVGHRVSSMGSPAPIGLAN